LNILLIEPYYGGSHKVWADGYVANSQHHIKLLTLPAQFWKWRLQGGAVTCARLVDEQNIDADLVVISDMLNVATFRALTRSHFPSTPIALYFHESQLTYPQNARQAHGWRYGFINYISALAADQVFYNSAYHLNNFFGTLPNMLKHFADYNELQTIEQVRQKSSVLSPGLDLSRFDRFKIERQNNPAEPPLILWNHRWEADKNPPVFFQALKQLMAWNIEFRVAITGQNFQQHPIEFDDLHKQLDHRVATFGYVEDFAEYARLLWQADFVVSTANQEFFGMAVVEAIYCGCIPILPNRLNYPNFIPAEFADACLYREESPAYILRRHFEGAFHIERARLRTHIAQYDWSHMAGIYDNTFSSLIRNFAP
jgi:glycosyltransferase involved in cell wall biosynthesis